MSRALAGLAIEVDGMAAGLRAIPVRTPLVRPGDDLIATIARAVDGIARPGDAIAVSETVVAIAQGEFVIAEHVRPSRLAFLLCRYAGPLATISQPESMQLVIERAGYGKTIYATLCGVAGRAIGRRGVFYEMMGEAIAAFDGYTGTMPPYERAIVLSPRAPGEFAEALRSRLGIEAAVVDANDLERAKVLGCSGGVRAEEIERALLRNPHGNSDEQTPLVVLKWRGAGRNPLLREDAP
ncbi:MAG TPA: coenzyme F420-0:L-glutamate ligase [Candidatus Cybelea sp.]|nr:coenzyme F420-0:L-glutamate ligase [Candidatus Cybelea sp.]